MICSSRQDASLSAAPWSHSHIKLHTLNPRPMIQVMSCVLNPWVSLQQVWSLFGLLSVILELCSSGLSLFSELVKIKMKYWQDKTRRGDENTTHSLCSRMTNNVCMHVMLVVTLQGGGWALLVLVYDREDGRCQAALDRAGWIRSAGSARASCCTQSTVR